MPDNVPPAWHVLSDGHERQACEVDGCTFDAFYVVAWRDSWATAMERHYLCLSHGDEASVGTTYHLEGI